MVSLKKKSSGTHCTDLILMCLNSLANTQKTRLQKRKQNKKKTKKTGRYVPDYPPFQQFYHGNEWT